ncbi:MAG: ACT domain-containing protein [Chloroflexota bacterium]|nr:ACT domain-containing protein [Chloroflexota bacterium]
MPGETKLLTLLRSLNPVLRPGEFVYISVPTASDLPRVDVLASVEEPEGLSVVVRREDADAHAMAYDYEAINCNVIAGFHHDHLLVPLDDAWSRPQAPAVGPDSEALRGVCVPPGSPPLR